MKLVRESILEFERNNDIKRSLDVGKRFIKRSKIEKWFENWAPDAKYEIDENFNIYVKNLDYSPITWNFIGTNNLPNKLIIEDYLNLQGATNITKLPNNLIVGGELNIEGTNIKKLPRGLKVNSLLFEGGKINELPEDLKVENSVFLDYSNIKKLPDNFKIDGALGLEGCKNLKELPEGLEVGAWLNIKDTNIKKLPNRLKVGEQLFIKNTKIKELPKDLKVGGKIYKDF